MEDLHFSNMQQYEQQLINERKKTISAQSHQEMPSAGFAGQRKGSAPNNRQAQTIDHDNLDHQSNSIAVGPVTNPF